MSLSDFSQAANLKVKVTTLLDQSITGHIYAYSSSNEVLSLRTTAKKPGMPSTYRIINTAFIKSIQVLPPFPKKGAVPKNGGKHGPVTLNNISVKDVIASVEHGVANYAPLQPPAAPTSVAGKLIAKLTKTLGAQNVKTGGPGLEIVLFNEIKLSKPYTLGKSNIHGEGPHLQQVKNVVKEFWLDIDHEKRGG